ncbi:MAG TPA: hypothetical protein VGJ18_09720 [Gemmatimonadaceae bacterium]|jgi:hypothetical protein
MILQPSGPPDTTGYYRVAYVWAALLYAGYAVLLWARGRRVWERLAASSREGQSGRDA